MIKIDAREIMELEDDFNALSDIDIEKGLKQGLVIAGMAVQSSARDLVPVDTSALKISIKSDVDSNGNDLIATIGPTQPYGKDIEFGRPPGTQVSPNALMGWAKRKGLNPYAVAKSIEKKGTPAQPFLYPASELQSSNVVKILSQALVNAVNKVFSK